MLRKVQRSLGKDGVRAVMYVDRADVSRRGMVDVPAMQQVMEVFGRDVW